MKQLLQLTGVFLTFGAMLLQHDAWRFWRIPRLRNAAAAGVMLFAASWIIMKTVTAGDPNADVPTIKVMAFIVPLIVGAVLMFGAAILALHMARGVAEGAQRLELGEEMGVDDGLYVAKVRGKYRTTLDDLHDLLPTLRYLPNVPDHPQMTAEWVRGRIAEVEQKQEQLAALLAEAPEHVPIRKRWWLPSDFH
jgi:hypothetical protein